MPQKFAKYDVPVELADAFDALLNLAITAFPADTMTADELRIVELISTGRLKAPHTASEASADRGHNKRAVSATLDSRYH